MLKTIMYGIAVWLIASSIGLCQGVPEADASVGRGVHTFKHRTWKGTKTCHTFANRKVRHRYFRYHNKRCTYKQSRQFKQRKRIIKVAKRSMSVHTGFYRYNQGGWLSSDPTPPYGARSDCSQWARAVYLHAVGRDIGVNTWAQAARGHRTSRPRFGDLMFTSSLGHVEIYLGHGRTIGHGSAPIDYGRTYYFGRHFFVRAL